MRIRIVVCSLMTVLAILTAAARGQTVAWTQKPVTGPSMRLQHAMAYDSAHAVTVLFGGGITQSPYVLGETWIWNGTAWSQRTGNSPTPRSGHAMAYDEFRGVVVLFGGYSINGNTALGDTWEWNGASDGGTWTQRVVSGPPARFGHAMVYDAARRVTVLFGGQAYASDGTLIYGDTWEWNGTSWTHRIVSGPIGRWGHAMAYDKSRGVTVLFGGVEGVNDPIVGDTWEWNGTTWAHRLVSGPSARYLDAMAYDSVRHVTVLYGGSRLTFNDETWEWNGTVWTQRLVTGSGRRYGHAMVYDVSRESVVLFGGSAQGGPVLADTWTLGAPCASADFNHDGDTGTDQDIFAFFACLGGNCCPACGSADFNRDGDVGTDADIESFFRVLGGGSC